MAEARGSQGSRIRVGGGGLAFAAAALLLSACDQPKPRTLPPDPMAFPPAAEAAAPLSAGLPHRDGTPGFSLDHIGGVLDPMNHQPAEAPADAPLVLDGFGFDPLAKTPAKGVDVAVDGRAFGTHYGLPRADVAAYYKVPGLAPVGFAVTLPPGTLAPGRHTVTVRVIAADGQAYFESSPTAVVLR